MQSESPYQPEMSCQWCGGTIPEAELACSRCGAARPREDLVAPGYVERTESSIPLQAAEQASPELTEDEIKARQILKDLDAYIPDDPEPPRASAPDTGDDIVIILGILGASGIIGGLLGWFVAPSLIHDLFNDVVGVDTDGPEAFRRLGAFICAMVAMLFGALLVTVMRR
jgi:hypothetical protein